MSWRKHWTQGPNGWLHHSDPATGIIYAMDRATAERIDAMSGIPQDMFIAELFHRAALAFERNVVSNQHKAS